MDSTIVQQGGIMEGVIEPNMQPSPEIIGLAKQVVEARDEYERLKDIASKANDKKESLELNLYQLMEDNGIKSFKLDELGLFSRSERMYARISNIDEAKDYIKSLGIEESEMFILQPVRKRLNEIVKEQSDKGNFILPGIIVTMTPTISNRKS